jgi:hypothetical protein
VEGFAVALTRATRDNERELRKIIRPHGNADPDPSSPALGQGGRYENNIYNRFHQRIRKGESCILSVPLFLFLSETALSYLRITIFFVAVNSESFPFRALRR